MLDHHTVSGKSSKAPGSPEANVSSEETMSPSPGHVSSACPCALLTAGTFRVPGAGRPSRVRACARTAYMGRAAVFMGPGKVCGCLAPGVSGGPGATSCSDLESTFEASGTQRVRQCLQRWRQVGTRRVGRRKDQVKRRREKSPASQGVRPQKKPGLP